MTTAYRREPCPKCNGEGVIAYMDSGPYSNETLEDTNLRSEG